METWEPEEREGCTGHSANMCDHLFDASAVDVLIKPAGTIVLKAGLINQANGSAYIETEKTKIACAV